MLKYLPIFYIYDQRDLAHDPSNDRLPREELVSSKQSTDCL